MTVFAPGKTSFAAGEVSELVYGRYDGDMYAAALAKCENYVVRPQGPATRRPPTQFVKEALAASRLIPFEFSLADSYMIEIGNLVARFFRAGGIIETTPGNPYTVTLPYTTAQLPTLRHTNVGDLVFLFSGSHAMRQLARVTDTNWTLTQPTLTGYTGGNPIAGAIWQQRLWLTDGVFVYASALGDFFNFTVNAADPATGLKERLSAGTQRNNDPVWFCSGKTLIVGTLGEEYSLSAASISDGASIANFKISTGTTEGSRPIEPVLINGEVLHISRSGRQLLRLFYDYQIDNFRSEDVALLAEHVTAPGVKRTAWQRDPLRVLWTLLDDGKLHAVTYNPRAEVVAFHRHNFNGAIDDIAVIPSDEGAYDELWLIVRRTIGGVEKRYVERMRRYFDRSIDTTAGAIAHFDCQITGSFDPPVTTILGLDHLDGETISVVADGSALEGLLVEFDRVELPRAASEIAAGIPYRSRLQLLPVQLAMQDGPSDGNAREIKQVAIRLHGAPGGLVGRLDRGEADMEELLAWNGEMDAAPQLFKGLKNVAVTDDWSDEDFLDIVTDAPFPLDVISIKRIADMAEA